MDVSEINVPEQSHVKTLAPIRLVDANLPICSLLFTRVDDRTVPQPAIVQPLPLNLITIVLSLFSNQATKSTPMNVNLDARKYILSSLGVLCAMMFAIPRLSADNGNPDWPKNNATTVLSVWPDLAPGETSRETGTQLPAKSGETKPIDRVSDVRRPTLDVYPAKNNPSGTAVIILPGGGFTYVVPNLEGSEAAEWLNDIGITAFVLRYRTKESAEPGEPLWQRPLQDTQRAMRLIRHESQRWQLQTDRIGILAFSAGGQVGAIAHSKANQATYTALDAIDKKACNPDFSILIYPWQLLDVKTGELLDPIQITDQSAPAFIVHTHDDASSSVGAAKLYIALKQHKVPAELHVYQNGGHGYGVRDRPNSVISSWPARATDWLTIRGLLDPKN